MSTGWAHVHKSGCSRSFLLHEKNVPSIQMRRGSYSHLNLRDAGIVHPLRISAGYAAIFHSLIESNPTLHKEPQLARVRVSIQRHEPPKRKYAMAVYDMINQCISEHKLRDTHQFSMSQSPALKSIHVILLPTHTHSTTVSFLLESIMRWGIVKRIFHLE